MKPEDVGAALAAEVVDDRLGVLVMLGRPDAFDISIVQVEGGEVRLESWRYYQYAMRVDFVDGEAVWTGELPDVPEGMLFAACAAHRQRCCNPYRQLPMPGLLFECQNHPQRKHP